MKIFVANYQPNRVGGGWTFANNFVKGMGDLIGSYEESDIYFIAGTTMVERKDVEKARADGKKIVLRLDNALRNSNNRGTGMSRMKDFCEMADLVIYQSQWAKHFLMPFTQKEGAVILNGVDKSIFYPGDDLNAGNFLYCRSSRDEGKGWINAWYWWVNSPKEDVLNIVGKFSSENIDWNFDFYNGESYRFLGERNDMPDIYRQNGHLLYTYLNDACSNTLLEAIASGLQIIDVDGMLQTGGAPEIMMCEDISLERMCNQYKKEFEKL